MMDLKMSENMSQKPNFQAIQTVEPIEEEEQALNEIRRSTSSKFLSSKEGTLSCNSGDSEEIRLKRRVIKYMTPLSHNRIRQNILKTDPLVQENENFKAISRLAFEKDPNSQLQAVLLDYYSLDQFSGPIIFTEGMQKLYFKGRKMN